MGLLNDPLRGSCGWCICYNMCPIGTIFVLINLGLMLGLFRRLIQGQRLRLKDKMICGAIILFSITGIISSFNTLFTEQWAGSIVSLLLNLGLIGVTIYLLLFYGRERVQRGKRKKSIKAANKVNRGMVKAASKGDLTESSAVVITDPQAFIEAATRAGIDTQGRDLGAIAQDVVRFASKESKKRLRADMSIEQQALAIMRGDV